MASFPHLIHHYGFENRAAFHFRRCPPIEDIDGDVHVAGDAGGGGSCWAILLFAAKILI